MVLDKKIGTQENGTRNNLQRTSGEAVQTKSDFTLADIVNLKGPWFNEVSVGNPQLFQLYVRNKARERPVNVAHPAANDPFRPLFLELRVESKGGGQIRYASVYNSLDEKSCGRIEYDGFLNNVRSLAAIDTDYTYGSGASEGELEFILKRVQNIYED